MKIVNQLKSRGIKPGLGTITELLRRLGDPQSAFKTVHIAGTNGKGSTAAMLSEMLIRAGYVPAVYTSPHLHRFSERVVVNRIEASEYELERIEAEVDKAARGEVGEGFKPSPTSLRPKTKDRRLERIEPTYFEFTTAVAFMYFAQQKPDIAIVEVGLGGRLDATNLVDTVVSVITPLSIDHTEFLGDGIRSMAYEKGGIIKPGVPAVIAAQPSEALAVIEEKANSVGAPLVIEGRDFSTDDSDYPSFDFHGPLSNIKGLKCGLLGRHQVRNAGVALAVVDVLEKQGFIDAIPNESKKWGIEKTVWPGRMELIDGRPPIVLDGTHNVGGAKVLADELPEEFPRKPVHLLMGMQVTKDLSCFIETLAPILSSVHAVPIREMECFAPDDIAETARRAGITASSYDTVKGGLEGVIESAMKSATKDDLVLVAGSLYLVGEVGELLNK